MDYNDKLSAEKYIFAYLEAEEKEGYLCFYRFSRKQREFYNACSGFYGSRSRFQSGVYVEVEECKKISFDYKVFENSRSDLYFDIVTDNKNSEAIAVADGETHFERNFSGESVKLYLPYYAEIGIKNIEIEGTEVKNSKYIFCFGDSITQGYHSGISSNGYPQVFGRSFNAVAYNFGIGGYNFNRGILGDIDLLPEPSLITVAYGSNDWNFEKPFEEEVRVIFSALNKRFPDIPVFVVLPIARKTMNEVKLSGTLEDVRDRIAKEAEKYENFMVLKRGIEISVENDLSDDGIHPHSSGMERLGKILLEEARNKCSKIF